ncbi:DUF3472 domain-containing protein [Streptomyces sp. LHD-70]|uniref:DUF3472 domain-containing protein n=1 Tax=Streptomyces sp. LHD-70 TaxID=3072140 RepID=UPI00280DC8F0|nr:DUF3472 domain-containing protein [Streptomyces sp. LHD-70]MDQ8707924.1 DUF3472 domain-containing protein [Streptomyces sp. LHD-70]
MTVSSASPPGRRLATVAAALGLAVGVTLAGGPSPAAAQSIGTTPGTYTYYSFPTAAEGLSEVTWSTTVTQDPGFNSNVFWSHQFGFNVGNGAYIGMQRNGGDKPLFLFSVWDSFERKPGSEGSYCIQFGGEGEGSSCRMNLDWKEGHTYTSSVAYEGDGWFGATVKNTTTGESFKLGSVKTPATAIKPTGLIDWVEYFEWNDPRATCFDQPYSDAHFGLPTGSRQGGGAAVGVATRTKSNPPCAAEVTERSDGSTDQRLALGNSVRAEISGSDDRCLAPSRAKGGAAATLKKCTGDGPGGFDQSWVLAADGTVRLPSDYCLAADGRKSVRVLDCAGDLATGGKVTDPQKLWSYDTEAKTLVNRGTGRYLTETGDGSGVGLAEGGGGRQRWTAPAPTSIT